MLRSAPNPLTLRFAALLCLVALTLTPTRAQERPKPERRASLVWLLGSTELKLERRSLQQFGKNVDTMLIEIANARAEKDVVRVRALAALGLFPNDGTFAFLTSLPLERGLFDDDLGLQMRRQAIRSIGHAFGERGVDTLLMTVDDPNPQIRQDTAKALMASGSTRILPTLERWLADEPDFLVRLAVDEAIQRIQGR